MKKLLFTLFLLGVLLGSCSDNVTDPDPPDEPGWDDEFVQDYHLILWYEDSLSAGNDFLWDSLPDTLAKVDSAIAFLRVSETDTVDFTQVVGKDKLILKEDFGKSIYLDVIEPGNKIFSVNYPDDVPWDFTTYNKDFLIYIYISTFDSSYIFLRGYIEGYFYYYPPVTDTSLSNGILTRIHRYGSDPIIINTHDIGHVYFEK